mgnify:FL=1
MVDQYGGTPFSYFLGGSKKRNSRNRTFKRSPKRVITKKPSRKKRTGKKKALTRIKGSKKIGCKTCDCSCEGKFTGKESSPLGLGFCEKCQPLNVIMRGKNGKLWKIEKIGKTKKWIQIN